MGAGHRVRPTPLGEAAGIASSIVESSPTVSFVSTVTIAGKLIEMKLRYLFLALTTVLAGGCIEPRDPVEILELASAATASVPAVAYDYLPTCAR